VNISSIGGTDCRAAFGPPTRPENSR
jgi:hypothetical protein